MQKITPCLWFNTNVQDVADFYLSIFEQGKIIQQVNYGKNAPMPEGTLMTIHLSVNGHEFLLLNGGPHFTITPAISFIVDCDTQEQVDYYWAKLLDGGVAQQCGWLTDRFGVSWQIVPGAFLKMLASDDHEAVQRTTAAMMQMIKLDLPALERAFQNK